MNPNGHNLIKFIATPIWLLILPWLGLLLSDQIHHPYLGFPHITSHVDHAPFSWGIFFLFGLINVLILGWLLWMLLPQKSYTPPTQQPNTRALPWWGWCSGISITLFWVLAWTRFPWFEKWQTLTFFPLWLSFIVFINALTYKQIGHCLLKKRPNHFLLLFVYSAIFWWYFEYLNRFTENWKYQGVESFSSGGYILHCTLAFSTVLPAIFSLIEWLHSFPSLGTRKPLISNDTVPHLLFLVIGIGSSLALLGIALWPNGLFPFVWIAPLLILVTIQHLLGEPTIFSRIPQEGWGAIALPCLAALICGFFWEMWNMYSEAKWVYSIPYVNAVHLFEMPLVGYGGYIPFGLECVVAVKFFTFTKSTDT